MNQFKKCWWILHNTSGSIWLFLLVITTVYSQSGIPEQPASWVNDYAGVLTVSQQQSLAQQLEQLEVQTSTQIFVAIFPQLPENTYLEEFCVKLYEKWRPGLKNEQNGVILAIFINDRKLRIEVGYGLEDVLTDLQSGRIINDDIVPFFKQGDYYSGIVNGLNSIIKAVGSRYEIPMPYSATGTDGSSGIGTLIFWIIIIFIVIMIISARRNSATTYSGKGYRRHSWDGPVVWKWPSGSSGGSIFGGGGRSSGGGGSFRGGFGGLSGGGGASGSW
ncbi:TPM domain-containing protein [candidate division KSB1 bacterium]|nr:TPM domain-containing protein [candidate division KSB1 bacterium]